MNTQTPVFATDFNNTRINDLSLLDQLFDKGFIPTDTWMDLFMDFLGNPDPQVLEELLLLTVPECTAILQKKLSPLCQENPASATHKNLFYAA